jgi:hypothetical protein
MNYQKIYDSIVSRGKNRVIKEYTECHHIIPRCMGGTDDKSNLVDLTPEEHYLCHLLLVKIYNKHIGLIRAAMFMTSHNSNVRRNNKMYGWLKRQFSEYMRGPNNPSKLNGTWNKGISGYKKKDSGITTSGRKILRDNMFGDKNPCAGIKPWKHPRATDYTRSIWAKADEIYIIWLNENKPSYCRLHTLVNGEMYNSVSIGPFMNLVKYFRNGWVPTEDLEWKKLKETI